MAEIKDKKPNAWLIALRKWNEGKGSWSMPKKGSKEYEEVRGLMGKGETPKDVPKEAPKDIPKEAPKAKTGRLRDVPVVAPAPVAPCGNSCNSKEEGCGCTSSACCSCFCCSPCSSVA